MAGTITLGSRLSKANSWWMKARHKRGNNMRRLAALILLATPLPAIAQGMPPAHPVTEVSIDQLRLRLDKGQDSSEDITRAYLDRIDRLDRKGPKLRAVIAINPDAIAEAKA